jgi:Flp pilus assembly protein TadG
MSTRPFLRRFGREQHGSVAEFALVLPVALMFLLGIVDAGRYLYQVNRLEKAAQMGARFAVVTNPVAPELTSTSLVGETVGGDTLAQGDRIPAGALGLITCTSTACTETVTSQFCTCTIDTSSTGPFTNILTRVQQFAPDVTAADLRIEYRGSGLGYAGDPNGMDIAPLVTVRIVEVDNTGLDFSPFLSYMFGAASINLPETSHTLTMEDASGTESN